MVEAIALPGLLYIAIQASGTILELDVTTRQETVLMSNSTLDVNTIGVQDDYVFFAAHSHK